MRHLLLAASLLTPGLASAHAILLESQPAVRGTVAPGATAVLLRFNSRIDHARCRLVLRGAPKDMPVPIRPDSPADSLAARIELQPGEYTLRWQVLAVDGHMTRGDVPFTIRAP